MMEPSSGTERLTTAAAANRITVPTRNETAAATTGPPTTWRSWLLMANCVGAAIPATSATGSSSQVIRFILLFSYVPSAGLVDVVEDRLYPILAHAGAVLDVAGALQVGKSRLHPVFEAGDLVFEVCKLRPVEDHVLLVVVLPDLPQPAPERIGLGR